MKKRWIILPVALLLCGLFACVNITVLTPEHAEPTKADPEQAPVAETSAPEAQEPAPEAQAPVPEAHAPASEPVSDPTAYKNEAGTQDADPAGERYIVFDNLCWSGSDGSPEFDIIDSTHMSISFPGRSGFSDLSVFVKNETDGETMVPADQQDDLVLTWDGDTALITMTDQARTAHYAVEFGDDLTFALRMDFIYGRDGDSVRCATSSWMDDFVLGLFNGSWDSEFCLTASEDAFFLGTKTDDPFARTSNTMQGLSFNGIYIDASDANVPKPTRDRSKADELVIETEELIRGSGRFDLMSIRCGDRYVAVNENGAIVFTTDREQRALWILQTP